MERKIGKNFFKGIFVIFSVFLMVFMPFIKNYNTVKAANGSDLENHEQLNKQAKENLEDDSDLEVKASKGQLEADLKVGEESQTKAVYETNKDKLINLSLTLSTNSVKELLNEFEDGREVKLEEIELKNINFEFTLRFALPEEISFNNEKPELVLEGSNGNFEVVESEVKDRILTVVIKATKDPKNYKELVNILENSAASLKLTVKGLKFNDKAKANTNYSIKSDVGAGISGVSISSKEKYQFTFIWNGKQSAEGRDFTQGKDSEDITFTLRYRKGIGIWKNEEGNWKYIKENGSRAANEWLWLQVGEGKEYAYKYFDKEGNNIDQFYKETKNGETKYYLSLSGPEKGYNKGWWKDPSNGLKYYFRTSTGSRVEGRQYIDGAWKFFRLNSGSQAFGWQYISKNWTYFDDNRGNQIVGKWAWLKLKDGQYNWKYFDKNGSNIAQFRKEKGGVWLSQAGPSKDYYKGWWTDPSNGQRYYFRTTSGSRVEGRQHIDGYWYYFRSGSGTQAFGSQYVDGIWRYYDTSTGIEVR